MGQKEPTYYFSLALTIFQATAAVCKLLLTHANNLIYNSLTIFKATWAVCIHLFTNVNNQIFKAPTLYLKIYTNFLDINKFHYRNKKIHVAPEGVKG